MLYTGCNFLGWCLFPSMLVFKVIWKSTHKTNPIFWGDTLYVFQVPEIIRNNFGKQNFKTWKLEDSSSLIVPLEGGGFLCLICNKEASTKGKIPIRLDITYCQLHWQGRLRFTRLQKDKRKQQSQTVTAILSLTTINFTWPFLSSLWLIWIHKFYAEAFQQSPSLDLVIIIISTDFQVIWRSILTACIWKNFPCHVILVENILRIKTLCRTTSAWLIEEANNLS